MGQQKVSSENAGRIYARRTKRDAAEDARWGRWWAALAEVRERLVRGVVDWDRSVRRTRLLPRIDPLPRWFAPAYEDAARAAAEGEWVLSSKGQVLREPRFAEAVSALVAGKSPEEAVRLLGERDRVRAMLTGPADAEFKAGARLRARADTKRAFVIGTRAWFAWVGEPELVRPNTLMLLAADAGLDEIKEGKVATVRKVWEKRLSMWKEDPICGPFGEPFDPALAAARAAQALLES